MSNEAGLYRVGSLVPGNYRVEASVDGFEPFVRMVTLAVSQTLAIDVTLDVARQSETVSTSKPPRRWSSRRPRTSRRR